MSKNKKAQPRCLREHPCAARVFSLNFEENMKNSGLKTFVPLEDYRKLEEKYVKLFKRYKKKKSL